MCVGTVEGKQYRQESVIYSSLRLSGADASTVTDAQKQALQQTLVRTVGSAVELLSVDAEPATDAASITIPLRIQMSFFDSLASRTQSQLLIQSAAGLYFRERCSVVSILIRK